MTAVVIDADDSTFGRTVVAASGPVLVEFWAEWCPPCKLLAPLIEDLARQYAGRLRVVRVNTDASPALVRRWGVAANPTLLFLWQGQEVQRLVGAWPRARIAATIEDVLAMEGEVEYGSRGVDR